MFFVRFNSICVIPCGRNTTFTLCTLYELMIARENQIYRKGGGGGGDWWGEEGQFIKGGRIGIGFISRFSPFKPTRVRECYILLFYQRRDIRS